MPKKTERRNPLGFSNIHSVAKHQKKSREDPLRKKNFEKKIRKKCLAVPKKNERGDSLVSPGMICYAEKQVNSFWSSSLGQMVLFDTIIFCRTFKNYFGQFVWIEKKKKSHYNWGKRDDHIHIQRRILKQAGTGPSRRHIQGSKIAKRLPSVKYSFTVVETRKFFENFFFEKITY